MSQNDLVLAKKTLKSLWGWDNKYWYPLSPTHREDVIALDCNRMEPAVPEEIFEAFICQYFDKKLIYVFPEYEAATIEKPCSKYGYWYSELCIAEKNLRNIVYWSHEGTITLGGKSIVRAFQIKFPNYENLLCNW